MSKSLPPFCDEMRLQMEALKQKILRLNTDDGESLWLAFRRMSEAMSKVENGYNNTIVSLERLERHAFGPPGDEDEKEAFILPDAIQLLDNEIEWCNSTGTNKIDSIEFRSGFVAGLRQAKHLLIRGAEALN